MGILDLFRPIPGLKVLVTAGASGLGAGIARALHETGAQVHICDVDRATIETFVKANPGITATQADVSDPAAVDRVFDDVRTILGGLDVLVNNAGIAGPTGGVDKIADPDWARTTDVNLNGQFYFAKRAVPLLSQSTANPCLIAMSSVAGRLGYAFRTPYSSTKWAIVGLVKSLAVELGPQNIRVNAILPGAVEGERMTKVIKARAEATGLTYDQMLEDYLRKISLRRMVTVDDVAAMAVFLCSPAGRNISGQAISVDANMEYL